MIGGSKTTTTYSNKHVAKLASGKKSLSVIAESMNELPTTIGSYLPSLIETDTLTKESRGAYALADNMFGYWLKTKVKTVGKSGTEQCRTNMASKPCYAPYLSP